MSIYIKKYFSSVQKRITFIGLGNMGYPMAKNLAKVNDYKVSGYDISPEVQSNFNNEINNPSVVKFEE